MSQIRVIYHLARADFLERVRRYSFLIMLGLVIFLGYQAAIGNVNVQVGNYRGEYNSAWVGSMMAIIASFFLSWLGFYIVKGSVGHDRETGVGQIMATTPLTRALYVIGKWLSNLAVLTAMVFVLVIAALVIQVLTGENKQLELFNLIAPFVFIALPMLALTAAVAVLFETIGFLSGGLGNVIYFFLFLFIFPLTDALSKTNPGFEPLGFALLQQSMGDAAKAAFPDYTGGFVLGSTDIPITGIFHWSGVDWTPELVLQRFSFIGLAILISLAAALFFDRFDPSRSKPLKMRSSASPSTPEVVSVSSALSQPVHLTSLNAAANHFAFIRVLISELKLLVKGQRWWWYAIAGVLFIAGLVNSTAIVRAYVLPLTWLWPILIWSGMGSREIRNNTHQMVFSSTSPLMRQLPAQWLAGFLVTMVTGGGVALRFLAAGTLTGLLAWISAAIFIPSLALALGVWSNNHKLFEVLYVLLWYVGPMNKVQPVDYLGASGNGNIGFFLSLSIVLIAVAFMGRARQLQN